MISIFENIKELNKNIKELTEAIRDHNIIIGDFLGYKVTYSKKEDTDE